MKIKKTMISASLALSASAFAICTHADCSLTTSGDITPPAGNELKFSLFAKGVQIHDCKESTTTPGSYSWVLRSPAAALTAGRAAFGIHYAGPRWKSIIPGDNSAIQGTRCQSVPSATANSISQLLLSVTRVDNGRLFGDVTYIQRVNTVGGVVPNTAVCEASNVGAQYDAPYTAIYKFYKADN